MGTNFPRKIATTARRIGVYILDTLAPQDPKVRLVEALSADEFTWRALEIPALQSVAPTHPGAISICSYRNSLVRTALVEIKDRHNLRLAHMLGWLLYHGLMLRFQNGDLPALSHDERYLVIAIPITRKKRRERGWNQCELILKGLKRADSSKTFEIRADILKKVRETADQVGKSRAERFENLRGCFAMAGPTAIHAVRDKNVIIFDDICTTGATFAEARAVFESAGAKNVTCVSVAR